jgi:glycosyltransferase involved in cell wall biosynthesis
MPSTQPKLLLIMPSTLRGGVEEYNLTAARGAITQGWDVHAAFPDRSGTATLIQDFQDSDITYHPLNIAEDEHRLPSVTRHLPRFLRTLRLLTTLKPDIAQVTLPAPDYCLGSILACGILQLPTVVRFGLVLPLETEINPLRIQAYHWVRSRCQQWVTISLNNRRLLAEMFQIPEGEIACIYNGAKPISVHDSGTEARTSLRYQVRQELGLPEVTRLLLTVGRLNAQKGYGDLLLTIPAILQEFPDVRFVWVGDGDLRPELEAQLQEQQVQDKVLLLGYRSDVPRLLQAADLFVFPTYFEGGQSFAIAEAMTTGLPIVTSDASGIPEVIQHQIHGLIFPKGNPDALLESLRWALENPEAMESFAKAAQKRAKDFTESTMLQNYGALWRRLSQRNPNAAPAAAAALHPDQV